jgi:hypothetical protein
MLFAVRNEQHTIATSPVTRPDARLQYFAAELCVKVVISSTHSQPFTICRNQPRYFRRLNMIVICLARDVSLKQWQPSVCPPTVAAVGNWAQCFGFDAGTVKMRLQTVRCETECSAV